MASKREMLEMAARLRATVSESKRQMLDTAADMLLDAAEAVERMTPRVVDDIRYSPYDVPIGRCPYCHAWGNGEMRHCDSCGQALIWGG